ncbi:MAG: right-handed parallel beta-helix repeat-containing protein, partial [Candidatus Limnocylindrales bacterium]
MQFRPFLRVAIGLAVATSLFGLPGPVSGGGPVPYNYPSPQCPESATGLQACIDGAASGDRIHLGIETINEFPQVTKSLTIDATAGFTPTVSGFVVSSDAATVDVTIERVTLQFFLAVELTGGSGHRVTLRRATVIGQNSPDAGAVGFHTSVPAQLVIERSTIRSTGNQAPAVNFRGALTSGVASVAVVGSRISQPGTASGGSGIQVDGSGAGQLQADIMNNTVWDVAGCNCGSSASLEINVEGTVQADINAVGNTFEGSAATGISLRNDLEPGGSIALDVFDNIISHQDFAGILLEDTGGTLTFRNGFNDLFQNGFNELDGASFAASTLHVSPRFVDRTAGKLKLRSDSPLIDAGQVCTPGGVADPDAAGKHRLAGPTVDIGAYEFGAVVPTGGVFVGDDTPDSFGGTGGADILCGYGAADFLDGAG